MKKTLRAIDKKRGELKVALAEVGEVSQDAQGFGLKVGRQAWLVALGTVATAEDLAGQAFDTLVAKGKKVRFPEVDEVGDALQAAAGRARELGDAVGERASHLMEKGSEKVLERFGVPSKHDIKTLLTQVQQLTAKVERMNRGAAGRARA